MPEYLSPGVYVEEIDAGPKPIEGVSTSTCGAVGVTARGPTTGKPVLVTSFADFTRTFGDFLDEPDTATFNQWALDPINGGRWWLFPLAVKGFFDNGGQRLYVKRVFSATATAAWANLGKGVVSEILFDAPASARDLRLRHLIGIDVGSTVQVFRGDNGAQIGGNLNVTAYNPATGHITVNAGLAGDVQAKRGDFVQVFARSQSPVPANEVTLRIAAKSRGAWGKDLSARVRPITSTALNLLRDPGQSAPVAVGVTQGVTAPAAPVTVDALGDLKNGDKIAVLGRTYAVSGIDTPNKKFNITPDIPQGQNWPAQTAVARVRNESVGVTNTAVNANVWTITVDDIRDLANGAHVSVNGREYVVSNVQGSTFVITPGIPAGETWDPGTTVKRLGAANDASNPANTIKAWGASRLYTDALVELDNGTDKERFTVDGVAGDTVTLSGNVTKTYYEGHKLRVIEAEVAVSYAPENGTLVEELFTGLRLVNDQSLNYLVNNVNTQSQLVEISEGQGYSSSNLAMFPTSSSGGWQELNSGGDDKLDELSVDDFVGVDGGSGARTGIQALEDIEDIAIALVPGIWAGTVQSALIQHCEQLRYRFAILDSKDDLSIEGIQTFREPIDTKYAALYYPWLEVRDPSVKRTVVAPPSGHMAGIYARVDVERGVHKAPANEVVRGIEKFAQDVTKREQDVLNPKNIDVLRYFPDRGYRVWGARVVTSDASWKYINVRRLFIFVEHSIDVGTQWVVFEPNDEPLWARVRQTIDNFLTTVWRGGALQGGKASEAFFVKCDRSTMTQDDIDNGRLICLIGIAPVKPAEFVIFRIQQKTLDQTTA